MIRTDIVIATVIGAKHLDLYRIRPAAEARRRYSRQPRQTARHQDRAANPARAGTRSVGAIERGRRAEPGHRLTDP